MLARPAQPALTFSKFAPARPDKAIKWVGAQVWQGPSRSESLLVADCVDEEWAKSLSVAYNDVTALNVKVVAANQLVRDLLAGLTESALAYKSTEPQVAETLSALVTSLKLQAKQAGFNPA